MRSSNANVNVTLGFRATLHKVRTATTETLAEVWRTLQTLELCSCCVMPCGDHQNIGNSHYPGESREVG